MPRARIVLIFVLLLAAVARSAELKFGSVFGDHMVIQRDHPIVVWGDAEPGAKIDVVFASQTASTTADTQGQWSATLKPIGAGGPFTLSATAADAKNEVVDVLVGDVWLCSGQSNMTMRVGDCADDKKLADDAARYPKFRLCTVANNWKDTPQRYAAMKWTPATKDTALATSAVGYFFATELAKDPKLADVPIGVLVSSVGGTVCEAWISPDGLKNFDEKDRHLSLFGIAPGSLYNGMIAPLGQLGLKGVIWYQGEGNAAEPGIYPKKLRQLIVDWRKQFAQPELPFLIIQLPDWADRVGQTWAWLRDAQRFVAESERHTSLVVTINSTDGWNLHPNEKHEVGRRAALVARKDVYESEVAARGPRFIKPQFLRATNEKEAGIRLGCDHGSLKTTASDGLVHGFTVAGKDGIFRAVTGVINVHCVDLIGQGIQRGDVVRYGWSGVSGGTLTDDSGLPAWPFAQENPVLDGKDFQRVVTQSQESDYVLSSPRYELKIDSMGQINSLIVGGKQLLSNEVGPTGGSYIPGFWGPRLLPKTDIVGPTLITCADANLTITFSGDESGMTWTFENRDANPVPFRLNLSPLVEAGEPKDGVVTLRRKEAAIRVESVAAVKKIDDINGLEFSAKPSGKTIVKWTLETKP